LGLIQSVEKWDWKKGHRFSTYSIWWIRQAIDKGMAFARQIRLPEHMRANVRKVKKISSEFLAENGRAPTSEEMAERLDMPLDKYGFVAKQLGSIASLDAPMKNGKGESGKAILDIVAQKHAKSSTLEATMLLEGIKKVVGDLPERQAFVLTKRYGLDGEESMTLQEVGNLLSVTRERVRQIEAMAMRELQNCMPTQEALRSLHEQMLDLEEAVSDEDEV
jgi:RNA polymerase sigma factor (sigma-70 family)